MVDTLGNWRPDFPGQQPYMDPQFVRIYGQPPAQTARQAEPQQQTAPAVAMTPPAIQYPVGAGMSQMMIARDETAIFVKTATANGYTLEVFDKRPPAPQPAPFNPDEYVRLSALPGIVAAEVQSVLAAMQPGKPTRPKKETEAAE